MTDENVIISTRDDEQKDPGEQQVQASLFLPTILQDVVKENTTRVSFVIYKDSSLFPSRSLFEFNNRENAQFERVANTPVISADVTNNKFTNLSEPVIATFQPLQTEKGDTKDKVNNYFSFIECVLMIPVSLCCMILCPRGV